MFIYGAKAFAKGAFGIFWEFWNFRGWKFFILGYNKRSPGLGLGNSGSQKIPSKKSSGGFLRTKIFFGFFWDLKIRGNGNTFSYSLI